MSVAEDRRKEKPQELATKKTQAVLEETSKLETGTAANDFKLDYKTVERYVLNRVQRELVMREIEQKVKLEIKNERSQE